MKTKLLAAAATAALLAQPLPAVLAQESGTDQNQQMQQNQQTQQDQNQTDQNEQSQTAQDQLPQQDREFAQEAAAGNQAELELANLAQEQASNDQVKSYAETLVQDHTQAGEELKRIAEEQGLTLEPELPQEAQQAREELSGLSGAEFDRAFVEHMVTDHEKAVQLYEEQAQNGENEALKQFAQSTVDILRSHLNRAQQLEQEMASQETAGADQQQPASDQQAQGGTEQQPAASGQQAQGGTEQQPPASGQQAQGSTASDNPLMGMTVGDIIGKTVVNQQGEEVGEIQDVVIGRQDKAAQAVVSVGGFLGIGDKDVAISFDELQPGQDEGSILLSSGATVEELKQRPAYDEASGQYDRVPEDQTPAGDAM